MLTLNPWSPDTAAFLESPLEVFIKVVKFFNEDLLEGVSRAKLIDLVAE
jgi:hypothetical protein